MGAVTDPRASMVFEWSTGTTESQTTHVVTLEIPPENIAIKRSKRVQENLTTKGYVFNHGPDKLPVISCRGKAYQPPNASDEGFNPSLALSGLELLNAAYVSSGRVSSSKTLVNSLAPVFVTNIASETSPSSRAEAIVQRVQNRSSVFTKSYNLIKNYGTISNNSEIQVDTELLPSQELSQSQLDSLQNMSLSYLWQIKEDVSETDFGLARGLLENLTVVSTNGVLTRLQQFGSTNSSFAQLSSKFEYFLYKFKNDHQGFSLPGLDPFGIWQIKNDPFVFLRSISVERLANLLRGISKIGDITSFLKKKNDKVITITLYWGGLVFSGHFESFNIAQDAGIIGLWSWDFTFVAHESWLLKGTNILSMTNSFDKSATASEFHTTIFKQRERVDLQDRLFQLSGSTNQTGGVI